MSTKKVIPIQPLTAWSFSRYSSYKQCPLKVKLTAIDKLKEPGSPAMERGNQIHQLAENYIKGTLKALPPELKLFKEEFTKLKKMYKNEPEAMVVEDQWPFDKNWGTNTTWFDVATCWARIKIDCVHHLDEKTAIVTDWKTGKYRPESNQEYMEQLDLYALTVFIMHPHVEHVYARLGYLDLGTWFPAEGHGISYERSDMEGLKKAWNKRVAPMLKDTSFAPRPNQYCRNCYFGQSGIKKGGPGLCTY